MIPAHYWKKIAHLSGRYSMRVGLWASDQQARYHFQRTLAGRFQRAPDPDLVGAAFGIEAGEQYAQFARQWTRWHRRFEFISEFADGAQLRRLAPLVQIKPTGRMGELLQSGTPLIFTTFHAFLSKACLAALVPYNLSLLRVHRTGWRDYPEGWKAIEISRDQLDSVRAMKKALRHLRKGGPVSMAFDGEGNSSLYAEVNYMGRTKRNPRGVASLAGMSGATIVPMTAHWLPGRYQIEVEIHKGVSVDHEADDPGKAETAAIQRLVDIQEAYVRQHPWSLPRKRIAHLARGDSSSSPRRATDGDLSG